MKQAIRFAFAAAFVSAIFLLPLSDANASRVKKEILEQDALQATSSPVDDAVLGESRGAFFPDAMNLNVTGQTVDSSNNITIGGVTGNNNINGGSFTNTQGLVNVIQNSGNNVVIQSSTIVNMTMINN